MNAHQMMFLADRWLKSDLERATNFVGPSEFLSAATLALPGMPMNNVIVLPGMEIIAGLSNMDFSLPWPGWLQ